MGSYFANKTDIFDDFGSTHLQLKTPFLLQNYLDLVDGFGGSKGVKID